MKIYGDAPTTEFTKHLKEPGLLYGHNDVLAGKPERVYRIYHSLCESSEGWTTHQPKIYLHRFNNFWSRLTGLLREYCLPWRWKVAYLDTIGYPYERALVCTKVKDGKLSDTLKAVIGKSSSFVAMIESEKYEQIAGKEFLKSRLSDGEQCDYRIVSSWGEWSGATLLHNSTFSFQQVYRIRGIFSFFKYYYLRHFSSEWQEYQINDETVLLKKTYEERLPLRFTE